MKNSCCNCTERKVGCHSWCPAYIKWKNEWNAAKEKKYKDNIVKNYVKALGDF